MKSIPDKKLRQITLAAKELFWKYGYKKVTIEEVCRKAKVSKMTFYKHFSNKTELIKHILSFIFEDSMKRFTALMESDIPFTEKVRGQIEMKKEGLHDMSELFFEDLLHAEDPDLAAYRQEFAAKSIGQVMDFYRQAQEKGEIRKDIKLEFILYFINHLFDMVDDENLRHLYDNPEEMMVELLNFFFYGITENSNKQ